MAKGQTTEAELRNAVQAVGGFSGLTTVAPKRRDHPFRERAAEPPPTVPTPIPAADVPLLAPARQQSRPPREPVPKDLPPPVQRLYDFLTVPLTAELRDRASALATQLQRRRTNRAERLTTNVVYRVAIETFLDCLRLDETDVANTEAEFRAAARKVFAKLLRQPV